MKRIFKRSSLICLFALCLLLMTGCSAGSTIGTTLTINSDFSGNRQMNIVIADSVFNDYFNGTIDDLNAAIGEACPAEMTWQYAEDNGVKTYTVNLDFSSVEDYRAKVTAVLGREPEIKISAPESVWATGLYVTEDFNSQELLEWLQNALVEKGYVSEENAGMIFSSGETQVVYGADTYSTNSQIYVDQLEYVSFDSIKVYTDVHGLDEFDRSVVFKIPAYSMERKGEEIMNYMNSVAEGKFEGSWETLEDGTGVFTATAKSMTQEQLNAFDSQVFPSQNTYMETDNNDAAASPFVFSRNIAEYIGLDNYMADNYTSVQYEYYVKTDADYQVSVNGYSDNGNTDYVLLWSGWCSSDGIQVSLVIEKVYKVQSVDVDSEYSRFSGRWKRDSVFTLEQLPDEQEQGVILERLTARIEDAEPESTEAGDETTGETTAKPEAKTEITTEAAEEGFRIRIEQSGTEAGIAEASSQLFGDAGTLSYAGDNEFWRIKKQEVFEENTGFGSLLENVTSDFAIQYTMKIGGLTQMLGYSSSGVASAEEAFSGGKLELTFSGTGIRVLYTGTRIDPVAIAFWALIALGVLFLLIVLIKAGVFKKKPAKETAEIPAAAMTQPAAESTAAATAQPAAEAVAVEPQPAPETPAAETDKQFCENCGAQVEPGAKFCENCGKPL